ncbi:MAG: hypothetical protein QM541_04585 [Flavobacterium sp.]|nr:hypothetical protein [Flavobacterium sp.]
MIKIEDFVVLKSATNDVAVNSVGIVREVNETNGFAFVFFIGKRVELNVQLENIAFLDIKKTGKSFEYKVCNVCHIIKKI